LVFSSSAKDNDRSGSWLIIVLGCFASVAEDDNNLLNLLSFSANFFHVQKTTMNQEVHHHLLIFFPQVQIMTIMNQDPGSSLSLIVLFKLCESKKYHKKN